jgi:hypothetical protein
MNTEQKLKKAISSIESMASGGTDAGDEWLEDVANDLIRGRSNANDTVLLLKGYVMGLKRAGVISFEDEWDLWKILGVITTNELRVGDND